MWHFKKSVRIEVLAFWGKYLLVQTLSSATALSRAVKFISANETVAAGHRRTLHHDRWTHHVLLKGKGKVHPCTGTEALYRPYGP